MMASEDRQIVKKESVDELSKGKARGETWHNTRGATRQVSHDPIVEHVAARTFDPFVSAVIELDDSVHHILPPSGREYRSEEGH